MSQAFSENLQNVFSSLGAARTSGRGYYPAQVKEADLRVGSDETADDWFRRQVEELLGGDEQYCSIEENLAVFLKFKCDPEKFTYIQCQAFAVVDGGSLTNVLLGEARKTRYLRLDYEPDQLGPLFTHPVPHIHSQPDESPRFALECAKSPVVLIDFFELLYRNFCHDLWLRWARDVWKRTANDPKSFGLFEVAEGCFRRSRPEDHERLKEIEGDLKRMKKAWREAKNAMTLNLKIDDQHRDIAGYFA